MTDPLNRVRYFTGQFLREKDFTDEQDYHVGMRRGHNRTLHTPGVVEGLHLGFDAGTDLLRVAQGAAIDPRGREILLGRDWSDSVTRYKGSADATHLVVVAFGEEEGEPSPDAPADAKGNVDTRFIPAPRIAVLAPDATPDADAVVLGRVTIQADGTIRGTDAGDGANPRRLAGARGGNMGVVTLDVGGTDLARKPRLSAGADGRLDIQGALAATGSVTAGAVGIGTATPGRPLDIGAAGGLRIGREEAASAANEIFFQDNGQIRSADDNHRLIFDRANDTLELRERGDILFSAGATAGERTGTMIVQRSGRVGIGTATPSHTLEVEGTIAATAILVNGAAVGAGSGPWAAGAGNAIAYGAGNVGIGTTTPGKPLDIGAAGGLRIGREEAESASNEILFQDNGQIRSFDDRHRLIFDRKENALELREYGTIRLSAGATAGKRTDTMVVDPSGNVGIGTGATPPRARLEVNGAIWSTLDSAGAKPNPRDGIFLGTHKDAGLTQNAFPLFLPDRAQGVIVTNSTDAAFFGLISRGSYNNDYNAVIGWGDDDDDVLEFRFKNTRVSTLDHKGDMKVKGDVESRSASLRNGDVAEIYHSDAGLEPGDVVVLDPEADRILRSSSPCDGHVIGIVSREPGVLLNVGEGPPPSSDGRTGYPVALCGRVPCKVTDENGPIRRGDRLTASSKPGHAMRAEPIRVGGEALHRAGTVIGKALEAHASGDGTIEVFVTLQ